MASTLTRMSHCDKDKDKLIHYLTDWLMRLVAEVSSASGAAWASADRANQRSELDS